jgi:hypothetical protein
MVRLMCVVFFFLSRTEMSTTEEGVVERTADESRAADDGE